MTAVIDGDGILFACVFGIKLLDQNNNPLKEDNKFVYRDKTEEKVYNSLDNLIHDILRQSDALDYVFFIKGKNTIKDRKEINTAYKANRIADKPMHYDIAKQYLIDCWNAVEVNDCEVDDSVRITANKIENSVIISVDKDLLNLKNLAYNWRKKEFVHTTFHNAQYYFWKSMITGDTVDGLSGLKNKGDKFAEKLLIGEGMLAKSSKYYPAAVLNAYIEHYGCEDLGIQEYYKSYKCLYILEFKENFVIPEPIFYKKKEIKKEIIFTF